MRKFTQADSATLKIAIISALRLIYDPEIPINIYDLGLIYAIDIDQAANVSIKMTLTTPNCPVAETLPLLVENEIKGVPGTNNVQLELVWDPPWTKDMMSESAREHFAQTGMM